MKTVVCAEIIGPFPEKEISSNYVNRNINVCIEFPRTENSIENNMEKVKKFINNKYLLINQLNKTIEDEQPISPGIFIITSILVMDINLTNIIYSSFIGYNVKNIENKLRFYNHKNKVLSNNKILRKSPEIFITPDGVGFAY